MVKKCCVYLCNSRAPLVTLFAIPSKPNLRRAWYDAIGLSVTPKKSACVCSKHFESTDFWPRYASGRISLRPNVVPSRSLNRDLAVYRAKIAAVASICTTRKPNNLKNQASRQIEQIIPDGERTNSLETVFSVPVDLAPRIFSTPFISSQGCQTNREPDIQDIADFQTITVENDENLKVEEKDAISETKLPDGSVCEFYSTFSEEEKSTSSDDSNDESEPVFPDKEAEFPIDNILRGKDVELHQSTDDRKRKASDDPLARLDGLKSAKTSAQETVEIDNIHRGKDVEPNQSTDDRTCKASDDPLERLDEFRSAKTLAQETFEIDNIQRGKDVEPNQSTDDGTRKASDDPLAQLDGLKSAKTSADETVEIDNILRGKDVELNQSTEDRKREASDDPLERLDGLSSAKTLTQETVKIDNIQRRKYVELHQSTDDIKRKASDDPLARLDGLRSAKTSAQKTVVIDNILRGKYVELNQSTNDRKRKASDDPLARLDDLRSAKTLAQETIEDCPKDGAPSKNAGMDFEAISRALERDEIKLPTSRWSHTRLGGSVIMFLCWDNDLRIIKKAVLRKGSQMSLYLGDQLLADGSTQDSIFNMEGCLRVLDMFEPCKGLNGKNCTWSENCAKYTLITDGNQICNACQTEVVVNDANSADTAVSVVPAVSRVDTAVPVVAAAPQTVPTPSIAHEGLNYALHNCHFKLQQASESLGFTSKSEGAVACQSVYPGQNVMIESTEVTTNSQYLVVDFVVSDGGITTQSIQPSVFKKPSLTSAPKSRNRKRKQPTLKNRISQQAARKPTARKSTGGPRKCLTSIEKNLPMDPEPEAFQPLSEVVPVEDEITVGIAEVFPCSESTPTDSSEINAHSGQTSIENNLPIDPEPDASKPGLVVPVEEKMMGSVTEVACCSESTPTDSSEISAQPPPVISTDGLKKEDPS